MMNQARAARTRLSPIVDSAAWRGTQLELARASAQVAFDDRLRRARDAVTDLARDPDLLRAMAAGDAGQVQAALRRQAASDLLLAVTAPDARCWAVAATPAPGSCPASAGPPLGMLLPREPGTVVSWPMLQRHSAELRARDRRGGARRCLLGRSRPASGWTTRSCSGWPGPPWTPT